MKTIKKMTMVLLAVILAGAMSWAQDEQELEIQKYKVLKQNGVAFVGQIISQDAREVLMQTETVGLVYIPKHEIKEIIEIHEGEKDVTGGLFATRYFLTTNGFHIDKGDNYVQWNLFGPDFQFGVRDNFTVGIMTSWLGMPIIATTKYSTKIKENLYGGVGFLGGTGSWAFPEYGLLVPYGFLSLGNRVNNINVSAGYGALFLQRSESFYTIINTPTEWSTNQYNADYRDVNAREGRPLMSIAGMFRINNKFSFVFDSFIMLKGKDRIEQNIKDTYNETTMKATYSIVNETIEANALVVLAPGLRFQANENSSFQFGFTGIYFDGEFVPAPIPMIQWFRRIDRD